MKHSAIILAGGKSSRMDYVDKAFLDVNGVPMIRHMLDKFRDVDDIIIVTNKPEDYQDLGVRVVTDIIPQKGPLSGMHSGLVHAKHQYSFITACDTPLVPQEYIDYCFSLKKDYDVAVPHWGGFYEPTCGIYSKTAIDEIVKAIDKGIRMPIKIYPYLKVHTIEEDILSRFGDVRTMFTNINTKDELDKINGKEQLCQNERLNVPNMVLIGSTGKNSGKTHFGTQLTKKLSEKKKIEVLKIATICEGATCIYGEEGCGICERFPGGYKLVEENCCDSGKDTAKYLASGAARAVLMKSTKEAMMEGFEKFLETVEEDSLIVCESNSLGALVKPGMFVMVQGDGDIKPSARNVMEYADVVYRNLK